MKKYIAEFFGTFVLALVVMFSIAGTFSVSTSVLAALVVGLLVYTMAHVSGTHLNPAVTIAAFSLNKISLKDSLFYIVAQFFGAFVAMFLAKYFITVPVLGFGIMDIESFVLEAIGAGILMFSISAFAYGKIEKNISGLVIGSGLLVGLAISSLGGANGILNPAIAMSLSSFSLVYALGPIVGAILAGHFYKKIFV